MAENETAGADSGTAGADSGTAGADSETAGADSGTAGAAANPAGPEGGPATPPKVLPWLLLHTTGRLGIFVLVTLLLYMAGLDFFSGALFGLLLSMPIAYLALRPSRERLSEALVARSVARRAEKEQLRSRLSGDQPPA